MLANEMHLATGHWLTLLGTSGAGKTLLARRVFRWWTESSRLYGRWISWAKFVEDSKPSLPAEQWADIREAFFLVIDDFGAARDPNGYAAGLLHGIMEARLGKWTLLTSNMNGEEIAKMDGRIASRLVRGGSIAVAVDVTDYNT